MKKTMMKTMMTTKNEKWIFYPNCQKKLQPRPSEDDGEIFADISDETMTKTLYVCTVTIKSFSFVPILFGYVIYKHHTVGIVLKVNPQSHCCYQTQSIKHTLRKISQYQRYFYLFRKKKRNANAFTTQKRKYAKAFISKNGCIAKKSLATVL